VIGANPVVNEVKLSHGYFHWAGVLALFALPLFFVFFQRLARTLERPELERRARLILKLLAWCLAGIGMVVAGFYVGGAAALIQVAGTLDVILPFRVREKRETRDLSPETRTSVPRFCNNQS
jgi:hypothetical protein